MAAGEGGEFVYGRRVIADGGLGAPPRYECGALLARVGLIDCAF